MNINASKELLATLASTVAIIAFLVSLATQMGEMRGAIEANGKAIAELRDDVRDLRNTVAANTASVAEMRGTLLSHIGGHNHAPVVAEGKEEE